jgi:hypothetical protein
VSSLESRRWRRRSSKSSVVAFSGGGTQIGGKEGAEGRPRRARKRRKGAWLRGQPGRDGGGQRAVREQGREKGRLAGGLSSGVGPIHQ